MPLLNLPWRSSQSMRSKPAGSETEALRQVVARLAHRDRIVRPNGSERRVPDQAGAERRADDARIRYLLGLPERLRQRRQRMRRGGERACAAVAPDAAGISEQPELEPA